MLHLFVCSTLFMLHLFSCCFMFHSFPVALFTCCNHFVLHFFRVALFQIVLFSCCTFFRVALLSCCTFFILHLFLYCTLLILDLSSWCNVAFFRVLSFSCCFVLFENIIKQAEKLKNCKKLTICYYHVTYEFQSESTLYSLPECQGTPCSKQAPYLMFKCQQRDSIQEPLSS